MILQSDNVNQANTEATAPVFSPALNSAVGHGRALFQLCLAISEARGEEATIWRAAQEPSVDDETFPARLNHYRSSPLATADEHINQYLQWQKGLSDKASTEHIRLWQAIAPDPLSFHNNAKKLSPEVRHNCPYRTQLGWITEAQQRIQETDPTLLADIIPAAQTFAV